MEKHKMWQTVSAKANPKSCKGDTVQDTPAGCDDDFSLELKPGQACTVLFQKGKTVAFVTNERQG